MLCHRFRDFELRPDERRLLHDGDAVRLGSRAYDLLIYLVENRHRVVSKTEMLDHVWPDIAVEEANLAVHISALRKAIGADAVVTVPGRGYRFVLPIDPQRSAATNTAAEMRKLPSIAVLPFTNMNGDAEQDFFADGLVEDLITALSKISGLKVIARKASFTFRDADLDIRKVGKQLAVGHIVQGSVRKSADRVRIAVQLIEVDSEANVWAERYDSAVEDIFDLQDEISLILATEMQVELTEGEQARFRYGSTRDVQAWSLWVRGLSYYRRGHLTREGMTPALVAWQRAAARDPGSASLNAMLGLLYYLDARFGFWNDRPTALEKGNAHVSWALAIEPENADAHMTNALMLLLQQRHGEAIEAARQSLIFGPGSADAAAFASFVFANAGLAQEAVIQIERAMELCPVYPPFYLGHMGYAYRCAGRLDDAIVAFETYEGASPGRGVTDLAIMAHERGEDTRAREWVTRLLETDPGFTISGWLRTQFRSDRPGLARDVASLRALGLPE